MSQSPLEPEKVRGVIEAVLMTADAPVTPGKLQSLLVGTYGYGGYGAAYAGSYVGYGGSWRYGARPPMSFGYPRYAQPTRQATQQVTRQYQAQRPRARQRSVYRRVFGQEW